MNTGTGSQGYIAIRTSLNLLYTPVLDKVGKLLHNGTFNSYTMGTSGLPDIYTRSPRAAGPRAEGVYIRRTTSAHGITNM